MASMSSFRNGTFEFDGVDPGKYLVEAEAIGGYSCPQAGVRNASVVAGDVNGDGAVDPADLSLVVGRYRRTPGHSEWSSACDLNGDGRVDIRDLVWLGRLIRLPQSG